ncbi:MAG: hypothetical protein J6S28_07790 [Clostridia bacterium]|nr:hypothetical protein [Clostridia bacterium]
MMKKTGTRKTSSLGYMIVGTLVVIAVLFCVLAITGSLAPLVLRIHAADAPAMMTMPVFVYCIFADFILLEIIFLVYLPGVRKFIDGDRDETMQKKALPLSVIVTIVCCVLLLCSILIAPNVCHVMTEQGVDSYVFFKTDSHAWQDIPLYELTFSKENGLELHLYFSKDEKIPMFGAVNSINTAFTEKYGSVYGFACRLKELATEHEWNFKVSNRESIEYYFKDSVYWEYIEKLIQ